MKERTKRKLLRAACHAAALTSWTLVVLGVPIAVLIISDDTLVCDSAKEAINFAVSLVILPMIATALCWTIIGAPLGFLMFGLIALCAAIMPIIAIVSVCADPDKPFRYPFTIRLLKTSDSALRRAG